MEMWVVCYCAKAYLHCAVKLSAVTTACLLPLALKFIFACRPVWLWRARTFSERTCRPVAFTVMDVRVCVRLLCNAVMNPWIYITYKHFSPRAVYALGKCTLLRFKFPHKNSFACRITVYCILWFKSHMLHIHHYPQHCAFITDESWITCKRRITPTHKIRYIDCTIATHC